MAQAVRTHMSVLASTRLVRAVSEFRNEYIRTISLISASGTRVTELTRRANIIRDRAHNPAVASGDKRSEYRDLRIRSAAVEAVADETDLAPAMLASLSYESRAGAIGEPAAAADRACPR